MSMAISRRAVVAGALSLYGAANAVAQETFPARPIRVIVPFGAGGLADVTMRIVGEKIGVDLGQQLVVVNQPGANGVTAAKAVLSAPADGHTLALLTNGTAVAAATTRNPGFDAVKDFEPISLLGTFDFVFLASASGRFKSLGDVLVEARADPGRLNIGTISIGSSQHLSAVLFKSLTGINATIVPFRNTPDVLTALLRGDIDLAIDGYSAAKPLIADGQLRALATSGASRSPMMPGVTTAIEAGVAGFDVTSWNGLFARTGTPGAVIDRLVDAVRRALGDAAVTARLADLGITPFCVATCGGMPQAAGARLSRDIDKWRAVAEKAGITTP